MHLQVKKHLLTHPFPKTITEVVARDTIHQIKMINMKVMLNKNLNQILNL